MLKELKADRITAMKEKNTVKKNVLSTLVGEIEKSNKSGKGELNDAEIIKIIKKMVENNITTNNSLENVYLEWYLPKMLTNSELERKINIIIVDKDLYGMKALGTIMKELNIKYAGQFDGKIASDISKKILL